VYHVDNKDATRCHRLQAPGTMNGAARGTEFCCGNLCGNVLEVPRGVFCSSKCHMVMALACGMPKAKVKRDKGDNVTYSVKKREQPDITLLYGAIEVGWLKAGDAAADVGVTTLQLDAEQLCKEAVQSMGGGGGGAGGMATCEAVDVPLLMVGRTAYIRNKKSYAMKALVDAMGDALTRIDLSRCSDDLKSEEVWELTRAKGLQWINLFNFTELTDFDVQKLVTNLPSLTSLDISECVLVTGEGLHGSKLTDLNLKDCTLVTTEGVLAAAAQGTLVNINLSGCTLVEDEAVRALGLQQGLTSVDLNWCDLVTEFGVVELSNAPLLEKIRLRHCHEVTDKSVHALATKLLALTDLDISHCDLVTNDGVSALAGALSLKYLNLEKCILVTDDGMIALARAPGLIKITVSGCLKLTVDGITVLLLLPTLRHLVAESLTRVNKSQFTAMVKKRKQRDLPKIILRTNFQPIRGTLGSY
jgi:hypothetical protein